NEDSLIIYFENEFQQEWVKKSYKDLISQIAKELTGNTYEIQFELESNKEAASNGEKSKSLTENNIFELWEQFKSSNDDLKYNNVADSEKRIQALEEKIMNLEKVIGTLVEKLDAVELKTQLEK
ncbi:DnaA N-terminal domain-containing protein, partial [Bacillus pacificus]|uniref:DnaA N-terminal domain-containing protein n=2 Tax=Bacillus TaxID=1386 RepID=UPI002E21CB58|nr:DnaA N-terminal domain-containing protein [Bacillus pacificus]